MVQHTPQAQRPGFPFQLTCALRGAGAGLPRRKPPIPLKVDGGMVRATQDVVGRGGGGEGGREVRWSAVTDSRRCGNVFLRNCGA